MSKTIKTSKGNDLPLMNLKGKDYLQVAYRLQWLADDIESYEIETKFLSLSSEETVAQATITLYGKDGKVVRKASATKRETKKDFSDHTEKAETGASGRALAMLGFGTQHAVADLDEGARIVDSPLPAPVKSAPSILVQPGTNVNTAGPATPSQAITAPSALPPGAVQATAAPAAASKRSSFKQPSKQTAAPAQASGEGF